MFIKTFLLWSSAISIPDLQESLKIHFFILSNRVESIVWLLERDCQERVDTI
jgi:hypothetical protein